MFVDVIKVRPGPHAFDHPGRMDAGGERCESDRCGEQSVPAPTTDQRNETDFLVRIQTKGKEGLTE